MAIGFLDVCRFTPTLGGLTDWVYSAAVTGYTNPTTSGAVDKTEYRYRAESADLTQWEIGTGKYDSSTGTFKRTTVLLSSTGAKVNFSVAPQVAITFFAKDFGREVLKADRDYYVATTGSDTLNDGLTVGAPFATLNKAIDTAVALDGSIYNVTINVADGTYTATWALKSFIGSGNWKVKGNSASPGNVILSITSANAILAQFVLGSWSVDGFELRTTTSGSGVFAIGPTTNITLFNVIFGACATSHIRQWYGAQVGISGPYTVNGNSPIHMDLIEGSFINNQGNTVTISGAPTIGTWLKLSSRSGALLSNNTYSGAPAAGTKKFDLSQNSMCKSITVLPGTVAGTTTSGAKIDDAVSPGGKADEGVWLTTDFTMNNALGVQKAFNASANGAVTLDANTLYEFEAQYIISETGTTSHTWGIAFGGTATITSAFMEALAKTGAAITSLATPQMAASATIATILVMTVAIAVANTTVIRVRGRVRVNAGGTFIPQVAASAAPGVAPVMKANSFFRIWPALREGSAVGALVLNDSARWT